MWKWSLRKYITKHEVSLNKPLGKWKIQSHKIHHTMWSHDTQDLYTYDNGWSFHWNTGLPSVFTHNTTATTTLPDDCVPVKIVRTKNEIVITQKCRKERIKRPLPRKCQLTQHISMMLQLHHDILSNVTLPKDNGA